MPLVHCCWFVSLDSIFFYLIYFAVLCLVNTCMLAKSPWPGSWLLILSQYLLWQHFLLWSLLNLTTATLAFSWPEPHGIAFSVFSLRTVWRYLRQPLCRHPMVEWYLLSVSHFISGILTQLPTDGICDVITFCLFPFCLMSGYLEGMSAFSFYLFEGFEVLLWLCSPQRLREASPASTWFLLLTVAHLL